MKYVRLCHGVKDKGILVLPEQVNELIDTETDWYQSIYYYNEKQYKQFLQTGTVKGIKSVFTDRLVFDFDNKDNPDEARSEAQKVIYKLTELGVQEKDIEIYFSGSKGFNICITTDFNATPIEVKAMVEKIGNGIKYDTTLYDAPQILRIPGTKHPVSRLYKIPLTLEEFFNLSLEEIKTKASDLNNITSEFNWDIVKLPDSLFTLPVPKKEKALVQYEKIDFTQKPSQWRNCKYSLLQGYFGDEPGERHHVMTILAATCRGLGYDKETTYYLCKSALKKQANRTGREEFPKEELWNNIISTSIFSDGWEGGQYSCKTDPWLKKYCNALGEHKCKDKEEIDSSITSSDMHSVFQDYAVNFENNIIKIGIPAMDENVTLVASSLAGLLGQPGCHAKGTEILMWDGSIKKVEDIETGDFLMGPDSEPRKVLELRRGKDKMVRIIPNKGEPFIINENHILNLKPSIGTNNKAFECNLNIKFDDYINKTTKVVKNRYKIHRVPIEFMPKKLEIPPYILGVWLGDGHSNNTSMTNIDEEIINEWKKYGDSIGLYTNENGITYSLYYQKGHKNPLREKLKFYNLLDNKHIPQSYLTSSKEDRLELLAGILDTDGSLDSLNRTGFDFISKYEHLSKEVVYLCRSLGLAAYMTSCVKSCEYKGEKREGIYYRVSINGDCSVIPCRVSRKKALPRKQCKNVLVTGFQYEYLDYDDYYGFTLDKDHLYLTADFIVHHNSGKTSFALNYLLNTSLRDIPSMFFSLDMGLPIVYAKLVQKESGLDFKTVMKLYKEDPSLAMDYAKTIDKQYKNVTFNFKSGLTVADMKNAVKDQQEKSGKKIKLVIVDYLECVAGPYSDPLANTGFVANQLKDMANELNVCVLLLLQTQKHSTPDISDPLLSLKGVKGSSLIEQSCSTILTLWRDGYNPNHVADDKYISFAIVKNRFGSLWKGDFHWEGITGNIRELSEEEHSSLKQFREAKVMEKILEAKRLSESGGTGDWG